jgi:hypothetical protein
MFGSSPVLYSVVPAVTAGGMSLIRRGLLLQHFGDRRVSPLLCARGLLASSEQYLLTVNCDI